MMETATTRKLEPTPRLMQHLLIDDRGYPVPWFVKWIDGKPEFRAADGAKFRSALKEKLCWVCGGKLGTNFGFLAGPMCGINRLSSEPPSHLECARWSARNCPFLNNPKMVRREDEQINNDNFRENSAGIAIARNPGVTMLWIAREYEVFPDPQGRPLIQMGRAHTVEWYAHGRLATRQEVQESIENGLPSLEAVARQEGPLALDALYRAQKRFERWLP